jgi:alcohol dehydrogenase
MKGTGVDVQGGHAEYMLMNAEAARARGIGGLGHLAVQYAKAAGFQTIAISHSPDKDKMIRDLGADEVVRDGKSLAAAGAQM